jgi:NDP-sugar pyrophosphorylase family protein
MKRLVGVIPAAGRGTRAYPYTRGLPKGMLEIDGEPIIARILAIFRDQMGIREIVIVVGEHGETIRKRFAGGSSLGVHITYVQNDEVDRGLSYSLLLARPHVGENFCVILSDECYLDSNHGEILSLPYQEALAVCAVTETDDAERVRKNYGVEVEKGMVRRLIEKPRSPGVALLGLGTFLFHKRIFDYLDRALARTDREPNDLVSVISQACSEGERVLPFHLRGYYVNVNNRDELNLANNLARSRRFEQRSLALAVIQRGSADRIAGVLQEFRRLGRFSNIALVLPPGTDCAPGAAGVADVVIAASDRYGDMMRAGLDAARGDILFTVYGDGTFSARDVPKFLEYLKEADLVVGTRTTRQLIHQGSNMRGIVRLAHVSLAKFLELVWWGYEPRFTDVGCTYRALWASTYRLIRPRLKAAGPEFSVEMLLETLRCHKRLIEIPVNFQVSRKGVKERDQNPGTFFAMVALILKRRFDWFWLRNERVIPER